MSLESYVECNKPSFFFCGRGYADPLYLPSPSQLPLTFQTQLQLLDQIQNLRK